MVKKILDRKMVLSLIAITIAVGLITNPSGSFANQGYFLLLCAFMY